MKYALTQTGLAQTLQVRRGKLFIIDAWHLYDHFICANDMKINDTSSGSSDLQLDYTYNMFWG